mgnify:CR=1 FL=1
MKLSRDLDYSSYLYTCNKCRSCIHPETHPSEVICPAFLYRGFITFSGCGKLYTAQGIIEEKISLYGEELGDVIYTCMNCHACVLNCPSALPIKEAIRDLRETFYEKGRRTKEMEKILTAFKKSGNPWGRTIKSEFSKEGEVEVFPGCSYLYLYPSTVKRFIERLKEKGILAGIIGDECCGAPLLEIGARKEFEKKAEKLIKEFTQNTVYFMDPHCLWAMKTYCEEKGMDLELKSAIELLKNFPEKEGEVLYHDSCKLGRFLGLYELPREVLKRRGVKIHEKELNRKIAICCGGNWGADDGLKRFLRRKHAEEIRKTEKPVVTSCPLCRLSFEKEKLKVVDIYEI